MQLAESSLHENNNENNQECSVYVKRKLQNAAKMENARAFASDTPTMFPMPCAAPVSCGDPSPLVAPALAPAVAVTLWLLVVVAGKSTVVVLRLELPYTSSVAPGASMMVVPSTVIVPPGVKVWPSMRNVVPVPGTAVKVSEPTVSSGGLVIGADTVAER
jgi:hypothetical protein